MNDGLYIAELCGHRYAVQLVTRLAEKWPSKREQQFAHFLSGGIRFPISVQELKEMGATIIEAKK